jgi:hypothetical protein
VARRSTFSAVHRGVVCRAVAGVHTLECERCSRRAERALARAEHGLERGPRAAREVASYWALTAVSLGVRWRGCGRWLVVDTLSPTACAWSASAREREGEVQGARWLASGVVGLLLGGSSSPIGGSGVEGLRER